VKTNIGHTEGAAGVAGLIKTALALHHRTIPANLHFHDPNPNIPWDEIPVVISNEAAPWQSLNGPPLAGVSAFGIAGTNAHIVLQAAPSADDLRHNPRLAEGEPNLLVLSAHTSEALRQMARAYRSVLGDAALGDERDDVLRDLCYSASVRRTHHDHRLACVVRGREDAVGQLDAFLRGEQRAGLSNGEKTPDSGGRVAFVFPGQGSQWVGVGRRLLAEQPVVRAILTECDAAIREFTGWSLLDELVAADADS